LKTSAEAPAPFDLDGEAGLTLEGLELRELTRALEGRAVWLLSRRALASRLAEGGCVAVGMVGPLDVLSMAAQAGWWASVRSGHELGLALQAGFPADRVRATGRVKEDGLVKDGLARGVAVITCAGADDRANVERIARILGVPAPPETGGPDEVSLAEFAGVGALLAPALTGSPDVAVDAPLPVSLVSTGERVEVLPLVPAAAIDGTLSGLSQCGGASDDGHSARVHGDVARGEWVVVPSAQALAVRTTAGAHPEPPWVLVSDGRWRDLAGRAAPQADPLRD